MRQTVTDCYRVALFGTGAFAAEHVRAIKAHAPRVELVAAASPDEYGGREFCEQHGIARFYDDPAALLAAETPDLVQICTPPHTHEALAIAALQAGAQVLCEKPLCRSLAAHDRLLAVEKASGKTLSTVFQWRFGTAAQSLRRRIRAGTDGAALLATCHTLWYRDADYYAVPWRGEWDTAFGGATLGLGIHLIDLMLYLLAGQAEWESVQAVTASLDRPIAVENVSLAIVRFSNGALASIVNSAVSPQQTTQLRLDFQHATVEVKALYAAYPGQWQFTPIRYDKATAWKPSAHGTAGDLTAQVGAWLHALDRHQKPPTSGAEGRRVLEFIAALYQSAHTGDAVAQGSLHPGDPFYDDPPRAMQQSKGKR